MVGGMSHMLRSQPSETLEYCRGLGNEKRALGCNIRLLGYIMPTFGGLLTIGLDSL